MSQAARVNRDAEAHGPRNVDDTRIYITATSTTSVPQIENRKKSKIKTRKKNQKKRNGTIREVAAWVTEWKYPAALRLSIPLWRRRRQRRDVLKAAQTLWIIRLSNETKATGVLLLEKNNRTTPPYSLLLTKAHWLTYTLKYTLICTLLERNQCRSLLLLLISLIHRHKTNQFTANPLSSSSSSSSSLFFFCFYKSVALKIEQKKPWREPQLQPNELACLTDNLLME